MCVFFYISNAKKFPTWHVSKGFVKTHFPKVALVAAVHVNLYKGLLSVGQAPLMAWAVHAAPTQHRSVRTQTGMDVWLGVAGSVHAMWGQTYSMSIYYCYL